MEQEASAVKMAVTTKKTLSAECLRKYKKTALFVSFFNSLFLLL